jgi:hypothetical protein
MCSSSWRCARVLLTRALSVQQVVPCFLHEQPLCAPSAALLMFVYACVLCCCRCRCEFEAGQAPAFNLFEQGAGSWLMGRSGRKVTLQVGCAAGVHFG